MPSPQPTTKTRRALRGRRVASPAKIVEHRSGLALGHAEFAKCLLQPLNGIGRHTCLCFLTLDRSRRLAVGNGGQAGTDGGAGGAIPGAVGSGRERMLLQVFLHLRVGDADLIGWRMGGGLETYRLNARLEHFHSSMHTEQP